MKRTAFITVVVLGAVAISAVAAAARSPDGARLSFEEIDANGDGEISRDELIALRGARFDEADINGDGFLDRDEMKAHAEKQIDARLDRMLARRDADGDGKLSRDEMQGRRDPGRMISRMDKDGNGTVSKAEFEEARSKMVERRKRHRDSE